jgi:hypothetical protein
MNSSYFCDLKFKKFKENINIFSKDLARCDEVAYKIWLCGNHSSGLLLKCTEPRGMHTAPCHTPKVAKHPFKMIEQMSLLGFQQI